jgi:hypothetical protein
MALDLDSLLQGVDTTPPKPAAATPPKGQSGSVERMAGPSGAAAATPETASAGESASSYIARKFAKGFGEGVGRTAEFIGAVGLGDSIPIAAARLFLPREFADKWLASKVGATVVNEKGQKAKMRDVVGIKHTAETIGDSAVVGAGKAVNALQQDNTSENPQIGMAPGPFSKLGGTVAEVVGAGVSQPLNPGLTMPKYVANLIGTGATMEGSGQIAKRAARLAGANDEVQAQAESIGAIVGGTAGAPVQVMRGNAVGEAFKLPFQSVGDVVKSARSAFEKRAAAQKRGEDAKSVWEYFTDDYKGLREKSRGYLQDHVNEVIANDLRNDPDMAPALKDFEEAVAKTGADPTKFNIAQKTTTPSLVATVAEMRPKTPADTAALTGTQRASKQEIERIFKNFTKESANEDAATIRKGLEDFQKTQALRIEGLNREASEIAGNVPRLSIQDKAKQGDELYRLHQAELDAANQLKNDKYTAAFQMDEQVKTDYDLSPVVKEAKDILKATMSKIDPATVDPSIRNVLRLFAKKEPEGWKDVVNQMDDATKKWFTDEFLSKTTSGGERVTLKDLSETIGALNNEIHLAVKAGNAGNSAERVRAANLLKIQNALEDVIGAQADPAVMTGYNEAVKHFKDVYVPRFRQGVNANLLREAGPTKQGRDFIVPEKVVESYLSKEPGIGQVTETQMREFDNLFGGVLPETKRVDEAYFQLERGVQSKYADELLVKGAEGFNLDKHNKFMHEYEAVFERVPALRDKLDNTANELIRLRGEADRTAERYHAITGSPITQQLGRRQSDALFTAALSDPRKMGQLITTLGAGKGGEGAKAVIREITYRANPFVELPGGGIDYDPEKLLKLLDAGKATPDGPGGLSVAFRAAFGKEQGDAHLARLNAIGLLAQRQALTDPRYLRPSEPFPPDLLKYSTGQTGASHITALKAMSEGRVSATYTASIGLGRFFNTKLQQEFAQAQQKALFDPDLSKAILDMAYTPSNGKLGADTVETLKRQGGALKEWGKKLTEHGMVGKHMFNAARVATTVEMNKDKEAPEQREQYHNEPAINR